MKNISLLVVLVSTFMLNGCAGMGQDQTIGTGLGAIGGVAAGSMVGQGKGNTAAMILGGAGGALLGSSIGKSMDDH